MTSWRDIAATKRQGVLELIPEEWRIATPPPPSIQRDVTGPYIQQYLDPTEIEITESDAQVIVNKASTGVWTALSIAKAFCHRAAVTHQLVNCLHEIFFEDAYVAAQDLDAYFKKHCQPVGPLHGLPVSLKDQFHVKNVDTHMGYVGWIGTFEGKKNTGKERVFESEMVKELRSQGAILYVKTSVPHTLMCGETVNNIIEYTFNPTNRNLSSGGSSGGEGALIALKGSPVGFGTDIGGSIRIPAAFNGLYGLKPSSGRLPYEGMANSFDGGPGILSVVGPLAPSVGALKLVTKSLLAKEPWLHDPLVHKIPWRTEEEESILQLAANKELSFAVLRFDGTCRVHPPVLRAVEETIRVVRKLGHEVIEWSPPEHSKLIAIATKCWNFDGGQDARDAFALSGEEPAPFIMLNDGEQYNGTKIMQTMVEKRQACKEYMEYWNSTSSLTRSGRPVDAIICPVAPFTAARPQHFTYYGYSAFVNLLDYTSVVVPVTKVDKNVDIQDSKFSPVNDTDKATQDTYDPEVYDGAPVAVQFVGRRLEEEKMLALADYISAAINK